MFNSSYRLKAIQLTLPVTLLFGLSSFNKAEAEGLGKWFKDRVENIGDVVGKAVDQTADGDRRPEPREGDHNQQPRSQNTSNETNTGSSNSVGILKPTAASKGLESNKEVANIQLTNADGLPLEVVVPGDDFFNPLVMPMFNGHPVISQTDWHSGLLNNERIFLMLQLDEGYKDLHGSKFRNKWLELLVAVREEHRKNYGSCHSRTRNQTNDLMFTTAECDFNRGDEFERKRTIDKFNSEVKSRFFSRKIKLPKTYYWAGFSDLGKYDFDNQTIELRTHNGTLKYRQYHRASALHQKMSISPDAAEQLINKTKRLFWLIKFDNETNQPVGGVSYYTSATYETPFKTAPLLK